MLAYKKNIAWDEGMILILAVALLGVAISLLMVFITKRVAKAANMDGDGATFSDHSGLGTGSSDAECGSDDIGGGSCDGGD